jgi:hypothetical protein
MKRVVPYIVWMVLAVPATLVVTFLCSPFWNWFESTTGIESFGHSGPADWCFTATYAILLLAFVVWRFAPNSKL